MSDMSCEVSQKTLICCKHALADHHKLWAGGIMFGYIVMNKPEIKFKDFDLYRSFYCGLWRDLKSKYGISGPHKREAQDVSFTRYVNSRAEEIQ